MPQMNWLIGYRSMTVQTAVEDIQIEKEKEFESINTYEPELEL